MKATVLLLCGILAATLSPVAGATSPATDALSPAVYTKLASQARRAGHAQASLFFLEQALVESVGQPAAFAPVSGHYWQAIDKAGDWSRAYQFFARLKAQFPDNPDVLANFGDAVGGLMGWLGPQYGNVLSSEFYRSLETKAMLAYAKALRIQPDSFAALLGRAIFLSYTPGGMAKAEVGFKRILSMRKTYPHYPYAVVYRQWAAALARQGESKRARQVLKQGEAVLGAAAFSKKPQEY